MSTDLSQDPLSPEALSPEDVRALLDENFRLRAQVASLQTGSEDSAARLASLYIAVNSVHRALDQAGVLSSVRDIVTTLIGSEEMAIFDVDGEGRLRLLLSEGIDPRPYQTVRVGDGAIGRAAKTGEPLVRFDGGSGHAGDEALTACIPLKLGERVIGVLAIFRLLPHKGRLDGSDLDLFEALTVHVAPALLFTRLYAREQGAAGASM